MNKWLRQVGLVWLLTGLCIMTWTFMNAYFHGFQTLVTVNSFGEAHYEFIILTFGFIFGTMTAWDYKKELDKECNTKQ